MTIESTTFINGLNASNPPGTDPKSEGAGHLRLIKSTIKTTFPNITGAVNATQAELNYVVGVTSAIQTQINSLLEAGGVNANDYVTIPFKDKTTGARRNLIVQWGTTSTAVAANTATGVTWTFPIAFPNGVFNVFNTPGNFVGSTCTSEGITATNATGFLWHDSAQTLITRWLAIGY